MINIKVCEMKGRNKEGRKKEKQKQKTELEREERMSIFLFLLLRGATRRDILPFFLFACKSVCVCVNVCVDKSKKSQGGLE